MFATHRPSTAASNGRTDRGAAHPWARRVAAMVLLASGGAAWCADASSDAKRAQAQLAFRIIIPHVLTVSSEFADALSGDGVGRSAAAYARSNGGRVTPVLTTVQPAQGSLAVARDMQRVATWFMP